MLHLPTKLDRLIDWCALQKPRGGQQDHRFDRLDVVRISSRIGRLRHGKHLRKQWLCRKLNELNLGAGKRVSALRQSIPLQLE